MAPKKDLVSLKKQLGKQKKTNTKKTSALKVKNPTDPTKSVKEEESRREFFKSIYKQRNNLSNQDLYIELKDFSSNPKRDYSRESFINTILEYLPRNSIFEYANTYLNGTTQSGIVLKKFIVNMDIDEVEAELEKDHQEEQGSDSELEDLLEKGFDDIFADEGMSDSDKEVEEEDIIPLTAPEEIDRSNILLNKYDRNPENIQKQVITGRKAIQLDENMMPIKLPSKNLLKPYTSMSDDRCELYYYNTPWLDVRAKSIWIVLGQGNNINYIHPENKVLINNEDAYLANKHFIRLQCGMNRNKRRFEKGYMYFIDDDGKEAKVKVYFKLDENNYIQMDKNMFILENKLYNESLYQKSTKIRSFANKQLSNISTKNLGIIKDALARRMKSVTKAQMADEIVDLYMEKYSESTIHVLLTNFSILLTYLNNQVLDLGGIFKERLARGYYNANSLIRLTPSDVLPEVYLDPGTSESEKKAVSTFISTLPKNFYSELLYDIYYDINTLEKRVIPSIRYPLAVNIEDKPNSLQSLCKNKDIPTSIKPYNLYIFKDQDDYYCADLSDPNPEYFIGINPYKDGAPLLSEEVYEDIKRMSIEAEYTSKQLPQPIKEEKIIKNKDKDNRLLLFILTDILSMENEVGKKGYNYLKDLEIPEIQSKTRDICQYCKKHIDNNALKSLIQGKKGTTLVKFCNTECFEKMDTWPKIKNKVDKMVEP